jgi:non-specific serine/threonine protein kinase
VESAQEYVPKARLMDEAWPGLVVEEANLGVQISAIRRALADAPGGEHWIETLARRGYRFVGPVTKLADQIALDTARTPPRSNLTEPLTSFIGREQELADLQKLLAEHRLLTLTGAGGVGKTRLALRVATLALTNGFRDGVWLIELASLSDPDLVPQAVASVLGLKDVRGTSLTERLGQHLESKRLLLVLDNAEHLVAACADLTEHLLRQCPQLIVLATSRERLGVPGEMTYRVPSLSTPEPGRDTTAQSLAEYESIRLFSERVRLHRPHFAVTDQSAHALASICRRLDGIPLAIELAAAQVRSMSVDEVNERLERGFLALTGGVRRTLPRQQTLRALIDWSYNLLGEPEQTLLCRVSVFAGGWTLAAAERVCGDGGVPTATVADLLTSLVDKNLVVAEEKNGTTRYRLLETVRQYAQEMLIEQGGEAQWRDRHLAYFLAWSLEVEPLLKGAEVDSGLDKLQADHDNLRLAMDWAGSGGDAVSGLQIAAAIWWFWYVRGHLREGRRRLSRLLAEAPETDALSDRAKALRGAGALARGQSDYDAADALYRESLAIRRALGDQRGIAMTLGSIGAVAEVRGDYETSRALQEESLAIQRGLGVDRPSIALMLNNLGEVSLRQRDYGTSRARLEEGLAIYRELGNQWGIALCLTNLGRLASTEADYPGALRFLKQALLIQRDLRDLATMTLSLQELGYVSFARGCPLDAARLWGRSELLREEIGFPLPSIDVPDYRERVASARVAMNDDAAFDAAWMEGRAMTVEQVIEYALNQSHSP